MESALVLHAAVSEAAVVGFPHEIKGEGIWCAQAEPSDPLRFYLGQSDCILRAF